MERPESTPAGFRVEVRGAAGGPPHSVAMQLIGELDLGAAPELVATAERVVDELAGTASAVDLDASLLSFVDSTGLRALMLVRRLATEARLGFRVVAMSASLRRLIELSGLGPVLVDEQAGGDGTRPAD